MSVRLLDVNVIISLLDSAHVHHEIAVKWFNRIAAHEGWSTCPITENGFIRIVSHMSTEYYDAWTGSTISGYFSGRLPG